MFGSRLEKKRQQGFTLIELLVVIAIMGVLAAVIFPVLNSARDKALVAAAQAELGEIRKTLELMYDDTGVYPNGANSLCRTSLPADNEVDLNDPGSGITGNDGGFLDWKGPYMSSAQDPWGTPYFLDEDYQCMASTTGCKGIADASTDSSVLVSCGPNRAVSSNACSYDADNIVLRLCDG